MTRTARPDLPALDRLVGRLFFAAGKWLMRRAEARKDMHEMAHCVGGMAVANSTHRPGEACVLPTIWPMVEAGFAPKPDDLTDIVDRPRP